MGIRLSLLVLAGLLAAGGRPSTVGAEPPTPEPKAPAGMDDAGMGEPPAGGAPEPAPADEPAPRAERGLPVGTVAPPIEPAGWANVAEGKEPTAASMKGKVLFLEFWETKCGPCIRQMPKVSQFHERFAAEGLVVLGVVWEGAALIERFSKEHDVSFPMALDPSRTILEAYKIDGFPTSYVIGRDGKVAAVTFPSSAERDIEKALGLGVDAPGALGDYLAAVGRKDARAARVHLERLGEKAIGTPVDLKAFATKAGGVPPADGKPAAKADGPKSLTELARARAAGDAGKAQAVLDALAAGGPDKQDLVAWARDTMARDFPVKAKELEDLVVAKRYDTVISTILDRRPAGGAFDKILKSEELQAFCAKEAARARQLARRGLLLGEFVLRIGPKGWTPKSQESSNELFGELSSSSWVEDSKTRQPIGMDIDGDMLMANNVGPWIDRQYARALVMESLAVGKRPDYAWVTAEGAKLRKQTLDALKTKYGA